MCSYIFFRMLKWDKKNYFPLTFTSITIVRKAFKALSHVRDRSFLRKQLTTKSRYFRKKSPSQMFDRTLNTPLKRHKWYLDELFEELWQWDNNKHLKPILTERFCIVFLFEILFKNFHGYCYFSFSHTAMKSNLQGKIY